MQVDVNVTRGDIVRFNVSKMFRLKSNLLLLGIMILIVGLGAWDGMRDGGQGVDILILLGVALVGGMLGFFVVFTFATIFVLLSSTARSGTLGAHTYSIDERGFREATPANESLNYWHSIGKVEKGRSAISMEIAPWLFHVLPRRDFESDVAYESFFAEIQSRVGRRSG